MNEIQESINRPHHRATTLTVRRRDYENLVANGVAYVRAVNDIVSTARCGSSTFHHMERRVALLNNAMNGGFTKVRVRYSGDCESIVANIEPICWYADADSRAEDDSSFCVFVRKEVAR